MLNAISEDEKPGMEVPVKILSKVSAEVNIKARLNSVKESIEYITRHPADIIFSDGRLSDGLSSAIFNKADVQIPVIFIAVYEHCTIMAFENTGRDYLMEPVNKPDLDRTILKYNKSQTNFSHTIENTSVANPERFINGRKKKRLIVKKDPENIAVRLEDIVLIYTEAN